MVRALNEGNSKLGHGGDGGGGQSQKLAMDLDLLKSAASRQPSVTLFL